MDYEDLPIIGTFEPKDVFEIELGGLSNEKQTESIGPDRQHRTGE